MVMPQLKLKRVVAIFIVDLIDIIDKLLLII